VAAQIVLAILAWLHIISAVGWLGASMIFGFVVGPTMTRLSEEARLEFIAKVLPRYVRFGAGAAGSTILFGLIFTFALASGDSSMLSPSNPFGLQLTIGALFGFGAFLVVVLLVAPATRKATRIAQGTIEGKRGISSEMIQTMKRLRMGAMVVLVLLLLAFTFMVGTATL